LFNPTAEVVGTAVEYVQAQIKRSELVARWRSIFADHQLDAVMEPGLGEEIWKVKQPTSADSHPLDVSSHPFLFGMWNDANFPALSVPASVSESSGGPVGIQIVGLAWSDPKLLQIGIDYQAATGYHLALPPRLEEGEREPYLPPPVPDEGDQPGYLPLRSSLAAVIFE
jgi:aspartyl-tRNA(Asn)/glutamyl-tRNA(Gln) amidotransferase subunit A